MNKEYTLDVLRDTGLSSSRSFNDAISYVQSTPGIAEVGNLQGLGMAVFFIRTLEELGGPALVVLQDDEYLARFEDQLRFILDSAELKRDYEIVSLPEFEVLELEAPLAVEERRKKRLRALFGMYYGRPGSTLIVLSTPGGYRRFTLGKQKYLENSLPVKEGGNLKPDEAMSFLHRTGYEKNREVDRPGRMYLRGGVLDVWPAHADMPVRIEFFGNTIDQMRLFDPDTQRSRERISDTVFTPASEVIIPPDPPDDEVIRRDHRELIKRNIYFDAGVLYPHIYGSGGNPLMDGLFNAFFVANPAATASLWEKSKESTLQWFEKKNFPLPMELFDNVYASIPDDTAAFAKTVHLNSFSGTPDKCRNLQLKMLPPLPLDLGEISKILRKESSEGRVIIVSRYKKRLDHFLGDEGLESVIVLEGAIQGGFKIDDIPLSLFTDAEMFQRKPQPKVVVRRAKDRMPLVAPSDIQVGDYVVHVDHGVGKYNGIITQTSPDGVVKDFFSLSYGRGDNLFVPIEQIERIEKYIGAEGTPPRVYPLHSGRWGAVKNKVKQKIEDMAQTLYALYTEREQAKGYSFSGDNLFMQEMEESFPYQETEDQVSSIDEVKRDMEKTRPMDRIVYGDVGYGKTEVAIRAAFKAVLDKKQVAILAPTTILSQQHARTFKERFARFPVTVEVLNRFRTAKEKSSTLKKLAKGEVDIVIGTHSLLQDNVRFKDLGLLIIDEEQRFGVKHKEKLKMMKINVDVLTLTATPIPRTLHMSMIRLRDMSIISTPPEDRKAVKTFVEEWNMNSLYTAVERELSRGGQLYFVHNEISSIDQVRIFLENSFPDARIAVCHGRMSSIQIENTMSEFMDEHYDILLSTTIIENGLDIPNVNTLIVNAAENFGLSQLYQLRGRVGRSFRQSYAYFFYSPFKTLNEKAVKRLEALRDFADLGSGYRLAMKDLEIRGAGNLLGREQHGFIAEIGFNLYCKMLAESVEQIRGEPIRTAPQVEVDLAINAFIPEDYIPETPVRTDVYKRLVSCMTMKQVDRVVEEISDRFGAPPQTMNNFVLLTRIRINAGAIGADKIKTHPHSELTDMTFADEGAFEMMRTVSYPRGFSLEVVYLKDRLRLLHEGVRPQKFVEAVHEFLISAAEQLAGSADEEYPYDPALQ